MIRLFLYFLLLLLFSACTSSPQPNAWQYKSSQAFDSYKLHYMRMDDALSQESLKRALFYAKKSANMTQLATIHLGVCAMQKAVGEYRQCKEFEKIRPLVSCPKVDAYARFIDADFHHLNIDYLPKRYRRFASAMQNQNYPEANSAVKSMQDPISKLIALSLLDGYATQEARKNTLQALSYYGYKRGVIYMLNAIAHNSNDAKERELLKKKVELLLHE